MTNRANQHDFGEDDPKVNPALSRDLRELFEPAALHVPPRVNERIVGRARAERGARSRRRASPLRLRWAAAAVAATAAATAAAVVVLVVRLATVAPDPTPLHANHAVADVNRDGRIDILDALALARSIGSSAASGRDITGDGVVDGRDVDAIAMRAVALDSGGVR